MNLSGDSLEPDTGQLAETSVCTILVITLCHSLLIREHRKYSRNKFVQSEIKWSVKLQKLSLKKFKILYFLYKHTELWNNNSEMHVWCYNINFQQTKQSQNERCDQRKWEFCWRYEVSTITAQTMQSDTEVIRRCLEHQVPRSLLLPGHKLEVVILTTIVKKIIFIGPKMQPQ